MVFVFFNGFLVKSALANTDSTINYPSTDYLDNVLWYKAPNFETTGLTFFTFHVKTTFEITGQYEFYYYYTDNNYYQGIDDIFPTQTYTAGQTYTSSAFAKGTATRVSFAGGDEGIFGGIHYWNYAGNPMFWTGRISLVDNPYPSLTITYPTNNAEIAGLFTIQGSFTQPSAGEQSGFLQVDTMPAGTYSSSLQSFWQSIQGATSGSVFIDVGNIPSGYYDFRIYFRGGDWDFYEGALISNVHIVDDLPQFIPPWQEQPPTTAPIVYEPLEPVVYYQENSTYETSTAMYNTLTGTFAPVLLSIGQNLTDFATRFSQSNASSTGNQLGASVVIARSYTQNINEFFSGFPLSQILFLYLIALVVVVILRLVKGLINLFKI
jgi:hypothetical protein